MRAIRPPPAQSARHTHGQRVCWISGVGKMYRWLAQLQKLAENEHFLCMGVRTTGVSDRKGAHGAHILKIEGCV